MTPPKKPRNNARKAAARAYQRETGLTYKQALAAIERRPPARCVVTADGVDSYSGSTRLAVVRATVQAAMETLEVPPERPQWAPAWWEPSRSTSVWERRSDDAYMILDAILDELDIWFAVAEEADIASRTARMATNTEAVSFSAGSGVPLRLELPTGTLGAQTRMYRLAESLALSDRDSPWPQQLRARLNEVREQLLAFAGAPVDEMRAEVDRLVRWLTAR